MTDTSDSPARIYWTAFVGLFFDYYDLYLFVYLAKALATAFALTPAQSDWVQFTGLAGVGVGALVFGYLADRLGRGKMMLVVFALYAAGIAGISLANHYGTLLTFRLVASLSLGAEWGISHTYLAERVTGARRYRFSALLQFSILGGLLAALASRYVQPVIGWRWLFAASIVPVGVLGAVRWRALTSERPAIGDDRATDLDSVLKVRSRNDVDRAVEGDRWLAAATNLDGLTAAVQRNAGTFLLCFALASLTIASGSINVFYVKDLPQSPWLTVLFWADVAPGMLLGAWVVRRWGVSSAMRVYAVALVALSIGSWLSTSPAQSDGSDHVALRFAVILPLLNGIPFGLMGAWFNEVFGAYRTLFSGAAYNLGRILAGFAPVLITALGLHQDGRYFLFTAGLGVGVLGLAFLIDGRVQQMAR